MENPLDNIVDLGLVNYVRHPENPKYIVFRFADPFRADSFEAELIKAAIWYEKGTEQRPAKSYVLFGIHSKDFAKAEKLNYRVEGQHKKPLIPFKGLRYGLLVFSAIVMFLALMGYCKAQNKLKQINELHRSETQQMLDE